MTDFAYDVLLKEETGGEELKVRGFKVVVSVLVYNEKVEEGVFREGRHGFKDKLTTLMKEEVRVIQIVSLIVNDKRGVKVVNLTKSSVPIFINFCLFFLCLFLCLFLV